MSVSIIELKLDQQNDLFLEKETKINGHSRNIIIQRILVLGFEKVWTIDTSIKVTLVKDDKLKINFLKIDLVRVHIFVFGKIDISLFYKEL